MPLPDYQLPPPDLLASTAAAATERRATSADTATTASIIEDLFSEFGVEGVIVDARQGPIYTVY